MPHVNHNVFRADALRRYTGSRDQHMSLNIARPRMFGLLWLVLLILTVALGLLLTVRMSTHAAGPTTSNEADAGSHCVLSLLISGSE
jgi:hypothetical protein